MSVLEKFVIVIPVFNDDDVLEKLLEDLAAQTLYPSEVIVADCGESGLFDLRGQPIRTLPYPLRRVGSPRGRGLQMNRAVEMSEATHILFLHADSRLDDTSVLSRSLRRLEDVWGEPGEAVVGHFGLEFTDTAPDLKSAYFYYESKSMLNREGTINGDQGIWIKRSYLERLGGFDESLPFLEDSRLVSKVFKEGGRWLLLPGVLKTSARRFEMEGFWPRMVLNALIRNFDQMSFTRFFERAPEVYEHQRGLSGELNLLPICQLIHKLFEELSLEELSAVHKGTGEYVRENLWQVMFSLDCAAARRGSRGPSEVESRWLDWFDGWSFLLDNKTCDRLIGSVTFGWFYTMFVKLKLRQVSSQL